MALKYLNLTGLTDLVTNIMNWVTSRIPTKTSEIDNDSGYITASDLPTNHVTTNTTQTISGAKTFSSNLTLNQSNLVFTVKDSNASTTRSDTVIQANSSNSTYGINTMLGGSSNTIVKAGEGANTALTNLAGNSEEHVYLIADGNIRIQPGAATYANAKTFTFTSSSFEIKRPDYERSVTTSTRTTSLIDLRDVNNVRYGLMQHNTYADKHSETSIYAYNTTVASGNNIGKLGIGCDASGNIYTVAPTPATSDNSTKIATTAWVTAKGYLTAHQSLTDYATKTYVDTSVANLVNSAPTTLDTLNELATALGNDPNFATTVATSIGTKANDSDVVHLAGTETITGTKKISAGATSNDGITSVDSYALSFTGLQNYIYLNTRGSSNIKSYGTTLFFGYLGGTAPERFGRIRLCRNTDKRGDTGDGFLVSSDASDFLLDISPHYKFIRFTGNIEVSASGTSGTDNYLKPITDNATTLGTSTNQWKSVYSNSYYLGSTAFGDIVTHNASEFLTSHQSLANYVTLDGTQTITGAKTFKSGSTVVKIRATNHTKGVISTGNQHNYIQFEDTNGVQTGFISKYKTSGYSCIQISSSDLYKNQAMATDGTAVSSTFTIGTSTKGVAYWQAPMGSWESIYPHAERTSITLGTSSNQWAVAYVKAYHAYDQNAFTAKNGNYTFLIRNDGSNTYFLMSESGGAEGTWSSARPLIINDSTGICNINGNAATSTQFSANKDVTLTGDVTGTASSKAGWSIATTLANSGVTAGTYGPSADVTGNNNSTISVPEITVDAKGRVTSVTNRTLTCKNNTYNVYNKTLTIQKNGTNVATFTSNSNTDVTANIVVPTKTSDLTNDSNFVTSNDVSSAINSVVIAEVNPGYFTVTQNRLDNAHATSAFAISPTLCLPSVGVSTAYDIDTTNWDVAGGDIHVVVQDANSKTVPGYVMIYLSKCAATDYVIIQLTSMARSAGIYVPTIKSGSNYYVKACFPTSGDFYVNIVKTAGTIGYAKLYPFLGNFGFAAPS